MLWRQEGLKVIKREELLARLCQVLKDLQDAVKLVYILWGTSSIYLEPGDGHT